MNVDDVDGVITVVKFAGVDFGDVVAGVHDTAAINKNGIDGCQCDTGTIGGDAVECY